MSSLSTPDSYAHLSGTWVKVSSPAPYVALVQLSRGPVNAFHQPFWTELGHVFDKIGEEPTIRAVVLASALPKLFSAGIDFSALTNTLAPPSNSSSSGGPAPEQRLDVARRALRTAPFIRSFQDSISAIERCPVPVIAATHGTAFGLSIDILAACDVRYAAENTVFAIKEVDVGLASDIGTLARLPKLAANQSLVHELAYTARTFSAAEAARLGLVSRVVPGGRAEVVAAALATACEVAGKSPVAIVGTKRLLLHARDHSVQENLEYTAIWNSAMTQTQDIPEAVAAFKQKRTPRFASLGTKL